MDIASIIQAGLTMLGLGLLFAVVLLIASIKLKVEVDPKVEQVHEALPNIDCGACGFAGCASYAKAIVADPELLGACAPGGADTSEAIAMILNLQTSGSGAPTRPVVHCRATTADKTFYAKYTGIDSCTAINAQPNVQACKFGCMGSGDCTRYESQSGSGKMCHYLLTEKLPGQRPHVSRKAGYFDPARLDKSSQVILQRYAKVEFDACCSHVIANRTVKPGRQTLPSSAGLYIAVATDRTAPRPAICHHFPREH